MFLPMAWHYCAGGIRALFGVHGDFQRTPKGHGERSERTPPINNLLLLGEAFWLVYSLAAIGIALARNNWFLLPLNITACIGFGMMLYWSWQERRSREQT
jgi:cellulose synthase (UDP-forming)